MSYKYFPQFIKSVWHAVQRSQETYEITSVTECASYREAQEACEKLERDQARRRVIEPDRAARRPAPTLWDYEDEP